MHDRPSPEVFGICQDTVELDKRGPPDMSDHRVGIQITWQLAGA